MNDLNNVVVEGTLVTAPGAAPWGQRCCRFRIRSTRSFKNEHGKMEETYSYFDIIVEGRMAEVCQEHQHIKVGRRVKVTGRLMEYRCITTLSINHLYVEAEQIECEPEKGAKLLEEKQEAEG